MQSIKRDVMLALGAFLIAYLLWQSAPFAILIYPLRLFVTFIHELGHGLATLLTGGEFLRFEIKSSGAGLAYSQGGVRSLIIPAGYMGTALFGAVLLYVTNRSKHPEWIAAGLGAAFSVLTLLYSGFALSNLNATQQILAVAPVVAGTGYFLVAEEDRGRWIAGLLAVIGLSLALYWGAGDNGLTMIFGMLMGVFLVFIGYLGSTGYPAAPRFTLNFLAFTVGLNAITDAWFLLKIVRNDRLAFIRNDAVAMAEEVGLSAAFWAMCWIAFAVVVFGYSIWLTFIKPARQQASVARLAA